jgi:hypothetical protein
MLAETNTLQDIEFVVVLLSRKRLNGELVQSSLVRRAEQPLNFSRARKKSLSGSGTGPRGAGLLGIDLPPHPEPWTSPLSVGDASHSLRRAPLGTRNELTHTSGLFPLNSNFLRMDEDHRSEAK